MDISKLLNWEKWKLVNKNTTYNHRIFIAKVIDGVPINEILSAFLNHPTFPNVNLLSKLNLTSIIEEADYVVVPHSWIEIKNNKGYLTYLYSLSEKVPILMINSGDVSPKCNLRNTLELRTFLHPWEKIDRKIILPFPSKEKTFKLRKWKPKPTISFMGYVPKIGLGSFFGENFQGLSKPIKSSAYLNRKVTVFRLSKLKYVFNVNLKIRSSYTAYTTNPNLDILMKEYESDLINSDYILCPRGSANSSIRFYESLSAGRTPILINSNVIHPMISNTNFWLSNTVNVSLFKDWIEHILSDWSKMSFDNSYENRQVENNRMFLEELKFDKYLYKLFQRYLINS